MHGARFSLGAVVFDVETAYTVVGGLGLDAAQRPWNCKSVFIVRRRESMSLCLAESLDIVIECAIVRAARSIGVIVESG